MSTRGMFATLSILAALAACGGPSTSVTQVWKAPAGETPPMKSMLVFAVKMAEASRRTTEDTFVEGLAARGVSAQPSYKFFSGAPPDRDAAREATHRSGVDGILVVSMQGVREKQTYVPGTYQGDFWGYYGPGMGFGSYSPGYVATDEIVSLESTLWDARANDKLVWSGVTQTTNPSVGSSFAKSVVDKVLPELTNAGFIPPQK